MATNHSSANNEYTRRFNRIKAGLFEVKALFLLRARLHFEFFTGTSPIFVKDNTIVVVNNLGTGLEEIEGRDNVGATFSVGRGH